MILSLIRIIRRLSHVGPKHYSTYDIGICAYILLRGGQLHGYEKHGEKRFLYTMTHPRMLDILNDFNSYKTIRFSPRAFLEHRRWLKVAHWKEQEKALEISELKA